MCSETFLRLPEEKRSRFLDAAWEEFTRVKFADASINQIVRRAGIARGSFYQYFQDKEALMSYLMDSGWAYLTRGYSRLLQEQRGDIFALQVACFDQFMQLCQGDNDPVLRRFLGFLRINPGFDMMKTVTPNPMRMMQEKCLPYVDVTMLRCQEEDFVRQVTTLCLMVLVTVVGDTVVNPGNREKNRKDLLDRLEIIRCGSVKQ